MAYENLPGQFPKWLDGNLTVVQTNENPVVLVLGTAAKGDSETFYEVTSVSAAAAAFGRADGTLIRGLYEVNAGGAENMRLMRIGAKAAKLANVGQGITIETIAKDAGAGDLYSIFWDDSEGRLRIWRVSDDLLVYDNYPSYPSAAIDENLLSVTGSSPGAGAGDIGSLAYPLTLTQSSAISGATFTDGNDGILISKMEKYESLFKAYKLLENQDIDIVVPMDVYLDDSNVADMTTGQVGTLNSSAPWAATSTYPTAGTSYDALGELFAQEYNGDWYFWWDMDRDGVAEIYPSAGSATSTTDCFGNALDSGDFHEVNFGYQLADFCFRQSEDNAEMIGVIGVNPPDSWSLKDVSNWIGRSPTYVTSGDDLVVETNGTGLLGNRWVAGRLGITGTGLPAHTVDAIAGLAYGGFIATDDGWIDGSQEYDRNDKMVDIGKYISVVGSYAIMSNPSHSTSYVASGAPIYGGFVSSLPPVDGPTNQIIPGVRLPFRVSVAKVDALAGARIIMFHNKTKGTVVADAPTAARPSSDYNRLTTVRIVKATLDSVRAAADPFLGKGISGARQAALETAIDRALSKLVKAGYLTRYDAVLTATPTQRVQGKMDLELQLVPAWELRQITIYVALSAQ